jgi:RND superfamily putative drug exporter
MAGIARWCFRHRWMVIGLWLLAVLCLGAVNHVVGDAYNDSFALPGTESTKALKLLQSAAPGQAGESDTIVWQVTGGSVKDPAVQQDISAMLDKVAHASSVASVISPYTPQGAGQISPDSTIAYAHVNWDAVGQQIPKADVSKVISIAKSARSPGVDVELGGLVIQAANQTSQNTSELYGFIAAAVILLLAFGSFFSMLLPLISAVFSLVTAGFTVGLISHGITIANVAPIFAALVGLGVGVDYALFIVTRHRNGLKAGMSLEESTVRALNTSGRAVLFAGATVCVAMLGLLVLQLNFLTGISIAAAVTVLFTVVSAITLLPAMLGVFGIKVLSRRERRVLAKEGPHDEHATGFWARWSAFVSWHPRTLAALALAVIVVLAIPLFSLRLGTGDQGNDPAGSTTRKAYDMLATGFGPGFNGPLQLVGQVGSPADAAAFQQLTTTVENTPGVRAAFGAPLAPGAKVGVIVVVPTTAPQDSGTTDLINHLRSDVIPKAEQGTSLKVYVGGITAIFNDFSKVLTGKLPLFIGVIVGLGFLLLLIAFRSVVVPLTSAVMNLLAAAASFGVVVAFFQWGWGSDALGLGRPGPVDAFVPVLTLAVLFGLSMDYQVFLVSRMHEEWVHTRDNTRAVLVGQADTGRVITAAATIMILIFLSFIFQGQRVISEFGIGLGGAVFLDAFVLRTVLVPSLMHIIGPANWWLPRRLDRALPHLSVDPPEPQAVGGRA